jgi:hypothetical protein
MVKLQILEQQVNEELDESFKKQFLGKIIDLNLDEIIGELEPNIQVKKVFIIEFSL